MYIGWRRVFQLKKIGRLRDGRKKNVQKARACVFPVKQSPLPRNPRDSLTKCRRPLFERTASSASVHVLVDDGVVLRVHDDAVVAGRGCSGRLHHRTPAADDRCQRLVRDRVLLVVATATAAAAAYRHEHAVGGWRVAAAARLVSGQHAVALVRTRTAGTRTERPRARLVVRIEQVRVDVLFARVHVRRHRVQMVVMVMVKVMIAATAAAVDQMV